VYVCVRDTEREKEERAPESMYSMPRPLVWVQEEGSWNPTTVSKIANWYISERFRTGSDHELIRFSMITDNTEIMINPIIQGLYNLKKADWTKFEQMISAKSAS
jgi:hypothetical protein